MTTAIQVTVRRGEGKGDIEFSVNAEYDSDVPGDLAALAARESFAPVEIQRHLSAGPAETTVVLHTALAVGPPTTLVAILRIWLRRHADKSFTFTNGDRSAEVVGVDLSERQIAEIASWVEGESDVQN